MIKITLQRIRRHRRRYCDNCWATLSHCPQERCITPYLHRCRHYHPPKPRTILKIG